jgi:hypothetical protein
MITTSARQTRRRVPVLVLWTARVLLGLLGAVVLAGAVYFGFFAAPHDGGISTTVDWIVGIWAMVTAVGFLIVAVRLGDGSRRTLAIARGLLVSHVVFSLVKVFAYDEMEAATFLAVDLLVLGLLAIRRTPAAE